MPIHGGTVRASQGQSGWQSAFGLSEIFTFRDNAEMTLKVCMATGL